MVPGSHLKRHALHDLVPESHTHQNRLYQNTDHNPAFAHYEDEIDVPLRAGDCVAGYGTLFHSSHANDSNSRRTCLTMWYYPAFPDLPERTRASVAGSSTACSSATTYRRRSPKCCAGSRSATTATPN